MSEAALPRNSSQVRDVILTPEKGTEAHDRDISLWDTQNGTRTTRLGDTTVLQNIGYCEQVITTGAPTAILVWGRDPPQGRGVGNTRKTV